MRRRATLGWLRAIAPRSPSRSTQREIILALFLLLLYGYFQHGAGWNENSRFALVRALVDDATTRIDPYHQTTGDKALYNGHYYSDKPPGSSFLALPGYALGTLVERARGAELDDAQYLRAAVFLASSLPALALALLLRRYLCGLIGERRATFAALACGLGSIMLPFASLYFGHAAATSFMFASFYVVAREPWRSRAANLLAAGFLGGWTVLVDVAAGLGVALIVVYGTARMGWRAPVYTFVGAAPPLIALAAYNWISFGNPLALGYAHLAEDYFAQNMAEGVLGVTTPRLETLQALLVGPRGLLILSPWVALAPLGAWAAWRRGLRFEAALASGISLAFLLANAGYYLPFGGFTPGPRFLMPAAPFLALLVAFVPRAWMPVAVLGAVYAGLLAFAAVATNLRVPEDIVNPITEVWVPRLIAGDLADNDPRVRFGMRGNLSLLPLGLGACLAGAGFLASWSHGRIAERLAAACTTVLVVLSVCFATPVGFVALALLSRVPHLTPR